MLERAVTPGRVGQGLSAATCGCVSFGASVVSFGSGRCVL